MQSLSANKIIITILLIVIFYVLFTLYSNYDEISLIYKNVDWFFLIPIFCILFPSIFIRSLVQRLLLQQIGIQISIKDSFIIFLSGLSMIVTPGGSGVIIKSHFLQQKFNHPIAKSVPVVFFERFIELGAVIILVLITLLYTYNNESALIMVFASIILLLLLLLIKNKKSQKLVSMLKKIKPFQSIVSDDSFIESLGRLFKFKLILYVLALIIPVTFLESMMFYLGFLAFNVDLGYFESIQAFYSSVVFGSFFFIPGGVGATESLFATLLVHKNIALSLATSIIIFLRLNTIWFVTCIGFFVAYFTFIKNKRLSNL